MMFFLLYLEDKIFHSDASLEAPNLHLTDTSSMLLSTFPFCLQQ